MLRLFCSESVDLSAVEGALDAERIGVTRVESAGEAVSGEPFVLLVSGGLFPTPETLAGFVERGGAVVAWGGPGEADAPEGLAGALDGWSPHPHPARATLIALRSAFLASASRLSALKEEECDGDSLQQMRELMKVSTALVTERDFEAFFKTALTHARRLARADGGSLYLLEEDGEGKRLRFKLAQNDSRPDIPFHEFTLSLDHNSIAGHVALSLETLVLDDVYAIEPGSKFYFRREFDEAHGYRTRSMVTIPMLTHSGEIVGVLQLINRKRDFATLLTGLEVTGREVVPFDRATVELLLALGGQVAVCLDNNRLYEEIQALFEAFVTASVLAIEQRDPTTSGHSGRVASLTVALAEAADNSSLPAFSALAFSREQLRELRYAGLLHDFGKVGVREEVLVKPTKLQPLRLELVRRRHAFLRRTAERDHYRSLSSWLAANGRGDFEEFRRGAQQRLEEELERLDAFLNLVLTSNAPTVLPEGDFLSLNDFATRTFEDADGRPTPYLDSDEVRFLSIRKGSLDDAERLEVESHVTKTYQFLSKIPWSRNLRDVPSIAYGHHEKLNGRGYPRGVAAPAIPVQTRMMTIADIFDALTASDRPYKRAVPLEKAIAILDDETGMGMLDRDLVELFKGRRVWEAGKG